MDEQQQPENPVLVEGELWSGRKLAPRRCRDWGQAAEWLQSGDFYLLNARSPVKSVTIRHAGPPARQAGREAA